MKCPNHPRNEVTGYCGTCAAFGCPECLKEHEGQLLCPAHYRPIAYKLEEERKREEIRRKHARQRLVVRYADGRLVYGITFALSPKDTGFRLERCDKNDATTGETVQVRFSELKAVFYVKSFDGKFDKTAGQREMTPEGAELVVKFKDGETLRGYSLHRHDPDEPRFYLIPREPKSNNVSILIERAATEGIYTPEEFSAMKAEERKAQKAPEAVAATLSQEETMGDFYFETRNYPAAVEQYRLALKKFPQVARLRKKIASAEYNIGINYIKRRQYPQALAQMESVLKGDPRNSHAHKKVAQLRHIIEKEKSGRGTVEEKLEDSP